MRMRRRRAERCLLRAEAALDADFLDDAREAIEEAAGLTPDDPAVCRLVARLAEARLDADLRIDSPELPVDVLLREPIPDEFPSTLPASGDPGPIAVGDFQTDFPSEEARARAERTETTRTRWPFIAAAVMALMLAGSGAVGWYWTQARQVLPRPVHSTASNQPVSSENRPGPVPPTAPAIEQPVPAAPPAERTDAVGVVSTDVAAGTFGRDASALAREPEAAEPLKRETETPAASSASADVSTRPRDSGEPGDAPISTRIAESTPAPSPPAASPSVQPALLLPEPVPLPAAPLAAVADIPAPRGPAPAAALPAAATRADSAPPPVAAVDREQLVRATLTRYENAYSTLNAAAASAVWPSVDRRALARAFEDLSSQTVTLGRCAVRMNGEAAQADCAGNASWTPKVGGGTKRAARRWRFELQQNGNDWVIVRAAVQ